MVITRGRPLSLSRRTVYVARVVGVLWDNVDHPVAAGSARRLTAAADAETKRGPWPTAGVGAGHIGDCMTATPPNYFNDKCFAELDATIRAATDAGDASSLRRSGGAV